VVDQLPEVFALHEIPSSRQLDRAVFALKELRQYQAGTWGQGYYDRLQRACSWLAKGKSVSDPEAGFVFSWIALNALSGVRSETYETEWWIWEGELRPRLVKQQYGDQTPRELEWYLWRICGLDVDGRVLRNVIKDNWSDVKMILRTRYLMQKYWALRSQTDELKRQSKSSEGTVRDAIGSLVDREKMYWALCEIIVWRLRVLRNQLFHGCATDTHSKRRAAGESELDAGWRLLGELVWAFLRLMATEVGRTSYWPPIPYPRVGSLQHHPFDNSWLPGMSRKNA